MSLTVGQVFAGYTVLRQLGAGGMGTVYLVAHPRLPRKEALKILPAELTADPEYRARFLREADLAAGLSHPHIVRIYDRGEHEGQFWLSMDYVAGTDAARLVHEHYPRGMRLDDVVQIVTAVGSALDYAHHLGVLHRDVKPANILLHEPDGQPRRVFLGDFGVARRIDDVTGLTAINITMGTWTYAAPEQLRGEPIDGRTDQYSLACTVFHLLTGAPPYPDSNPTVVIGQHVTTPPPLLSSRRPELAGLDPVFASAMAKNPAERFANCQEFAKRLSQFLAAATFPQDLRPAFSVPIPPVPVPPVVVPIAPPAPRRRPYLLVGALAAVLLLVAAAGIVAAFTLRDHRQPTGGAPMTASPAPSTSRSANAGPFTGAYRAEFGKETHLDGSQPPGSTPAAEATFALRSVCATSGCVATAAHLSGDATFAKTMVFDQIGNTWVAVAVSDHNCQGAPTEVWETFALKPGPAGSFTGEYIATSHNYCEGKRSVTFTRTGDTDLNSLPDPASLPRRVISPAESLRGRYHRARTFGISAAPQDADYSVRTDCLRTGDRCMSYFHAATGEAEPLVFEDGTWILATEVDTQCLGGPTHLTTTGQYPLPRPTQNPVRLLVGEGTRTQTGACPVNADFDETFTRTGD